MQAIGRRVQAGRAVIEAMIAGERDPRALAALGQGRMRNEKLPALAEALSGMRFGPHHAHCAASLLQSIDLLEAELRDQQERVTEHLAAIPGSWGVDSDGVTGPGAGRDSGASALPAAERLDEIPGLGRESAMALIAEIGLDMSRFPDPGGAGVLGRPYRKCGDELADVICLEVGALVIVLLLGEPRVHQNGLAADLDQMAAVGDPGDHDVCQQSPMLM